MVLQRLHMEPFSMWHDRRSNRPASLHITGPSQSPRVNKPHPASIAGTRPAVPWRPGKVDAQMVWNCPCVAHWYNRQFTEDTLDWYDIENRVLVVELIYNS